MWAPDGADGRRGDSPPILHVILERSGGPPGHPTTTFSTHPSGVLPPPSCRGNNVTPYPIRGRYPRWGAGRARLPPKPTTPPNTPVGCAGMWPPDGADGRRGDSPPILHVILERSGGPPGHPTTPSCPPSPPRTPYPVTPHSAPRHPALRCGAGTQVPPGRGWLAGVQVCDDLGVAVGWAFRDEMTEVALAG